MEHIAALLLIIGCSADLKQCAELPSPVTVFETAEECQDILPQSLHAFQTKRPRVFATCVPVDPAMEEEDAELLWDVTPQGHLIASVEAVPPKVMVKASPEQPVIRK
ncbi:hypothetical protein C7441_104190 [Pseudaminobacter salicylatoxidans]|uniref:Uncharacterized protein n=1 Tax=Pseudaminobacter salicylatoxidans TaxID=93369 RepID=A0A316C542_PSESE|nr:hypothetical protein [Pseudaminobacter salicylatoxidans]PWJ84922.1 hypothetical protein C7441_104190 [Pseudaminobacter salicylatoxidans]